jgi:hypothetical protein
MSLVFVNKPIPGTTESIITTSPDLPLRRVNYWDVRGEGEIIGKATGRNIIITHILHFEFSYKDLQEFLNDELNFLVGRNGRLDYEATVNGDNANVRYESVTMERWEPIPLAGQEYPCALKDISNTLFDDEGDADGGWFQYMTLYFRQLIT